VCSSNCSRSLESLCKFWVRPVTSFTMSLQNTIFFCNDHFWLYNAPAVPRNLIVVLHMICILHTVTLCVCVCVCVCVFVSVCV
jgi:hypothetical protein